MSHPRSNHAIWSAPARAMVAIAAWLLDGLLLRPAADRMQAKITALSKHMGLRSAEVIAFPQSRRRHPSPLLKLSQRAGAEARPAKPPPARRTGPRSVG